MSNNLKEAMTTITDLKKLAEAANPETDWYGADADCYIHVNKFYDQQYIEAICPATILKMIELIERQHEVIRCMSGTGPSPKLTQQMRHTAIAAFESFERGE